MKRFMTRGVPGMAAFALAIGVFAVACAPPPAAPPPGPTTTSTSTTTIPDAVPDCTPGAVGTVTLGENPVDVDYGFPQGDVNRVAVCWNFGAAGQMRAVFIEQCYRPADAPSFNVSSDCYKIGEININPTSNPTGSGNLDFRIFRGAEPSGDDDWGLFATGDPIPPQTLRPFYTGYIRVTLDSFANNADAKSTSFTYAP